MIKLTDGEFKATNKLYSYYCSLDCDEEEMNIKNGLMKLLKNYVGVQK